jgi:hypothetical protein
MRPLYTGGPIMKGTHVSGGRERPPEGTSHEAPVKSRGGRRHASVRLQRVRPGWGAYTGTPLHGSVSFLLFGFVAEVAIESYGFQIWRL